MAEDLRAIHILGSPKPDKAAIKIQQDIQLFAGYFAKNTNFLYGLNNHNAWLQLIKGQLQCNNQQLQAGDGLAIQEEQQLTIQTLEEAEFLFFEMFEF